MGVIGGLSTPSGGISIPSIDRIAIAVPNTEQSYPFPNNTKQFRVFNDGKYILKLTYAEFDSDTYYYPIYPGDEHLVTGISAPSVIIYIQSPGIIPISLEIWQ